MARSYKRSVVIQALANVKRGANPQAELESLLFRMMTEREKQVYMLILTEGVRTARDVATALNIQINNASGILKELYDDGILTRRDVATDEGREYVYEVKN